jgi:LmbE family N-acetylglucosaminyl deacetylase
MTDRPAIFYSPHQDDEAIAMAGAIREQKDAGRTVYLVLLTNGVNSGLLDIMNGSARCDWHETGHHFGLSMEQMISARTNEFRASAKVLGVDEIFAEPRDLLDDTEPYQPTAYRGFVAKVADVIRRFEAKFPGASHNLVSGCLDPLRNGNPNETHLACWDAALSLRGQISDFRFYRVYAYLWPEKQRCAAVTVDLKPEWVTAKREALGQYELFAPESGRYALGYHSFKDLIDKALRDNHEYYDVLP